ncbi:hypothetical protein DICVIV_12317 [Dictyocaulus viviparus]|uniref:Uncharacterized protein n=1 Tax=Dictyocaulus viviparus TaxID=29172 RepID=A0A0D8XHA8_DICVI|nr:hypothetical protein DICVIV_12317 [Dictyocaulus viviparus]
MANTLPSTFNPNDSRFKALCCHTKTFTIVVGIMEIFVICFILVAELLSSYANVQELKPQTIKGQRPNLRGAAEKQ